MDCRVTISRCLVRLLAATVVLALLATLMGFATPA